MMRLKISRWLITSGFAIIYEGRFILFHPFRGLGEFLLRQLIKDESKRQTSMKALFKEVYGEDE